MAPIRERILLALKAEPATFAELRRAVGASNGGARAVLNRLEAAGMVRRAVRQSNTDLWSLAGNE